MSKYRIGIDAMGGDFAPIEAVKGVSLALAQDHLSDVTPVLIGDEKEIQNHYNGSGGSAVPEIIHSSQVIGMSEHPTRAIAQKTNSSIALGFKALAEGKIDAFISAGNTGAMMVGSLYSIGMIPGIERPSLSSVLPKTNGASGVILDVGANSDVKAEILGQFAILGSVFAERILHIENPRVALLSIGEEKEKGNLVVKNTYNLLEENRHLNFVGNVEGRDLFTDKADVVVCDGFTGNIVLKTSEGFYYNLLKLGVRNEYLDRFNFENYGGTPVLGVNKPVIIGHGISKANTFVKMIEQAKEMVETRLIENIKESL